MLYCHVSSAKSNGKLIDNAEIFKDIDISLLESVRKNSKLCIILLVLDSNYMRNTYYNVSNSTHHNIDDKITCSPKTTGGGMV